MIVDSGVRREFSTGAVRDIQEGKGRCDLLPLNAIARYCRFLYGEDYRISWVLDAIGNFQRDNGSASYLHAALKYFDGFEDDETMILEVSKHFEEGATKYGENNWQKGIPVRCYIDSAVRHLIKYMRQDDDERHDRAFVWNILCAIWTCVFMPELNDYRTEVVKNESHSNN